MKQRNQLRPICFIYLHRECQIPQLLLGPLLSLIGWCQERNFQRTSFGVVHRSNCPCPAKHFLKTYSDCCRLAQTMLAQFLAWYAPYINDRLISNRFMHCERYIFVVFRDGSQPLECVFVRRKNRCMSRRRSQGRNTPSAIQSPDAFCLVQ